MSIITRITFQAWNENKGRPDDITLSDVRTDISNQGEIVPNVGDIITIQKCYPESEKGNFCDFKVIAKKYFYTLEKGCGAITHCEIYIIVKEAKEGLGTDIKE